LMLWVAADHWGLLTDEQRAAVMDHELSHIKRDNHGDYILVEHDITEFADVLGRHGFYLEDYQKIREAIQPHFEFVSQVEDEGESAPVHLNGNGAGNEDVLDQVGTILKRRKAARPVQEVAEEEDGDE
jgi:hypothetical protein